MPNKATMRSSRGSGRRVGSTYMVCSTLCETVQQAFEENFHNNPGPIYANRTTQWSEPSARLLQTLPLPSDSTDKHDLAAHSAPMSSTARLRLLEEAYPLDQRPITWAQTNSDAKKLRLLDTEISKNRHYSHQERILFT